MILPERGQEVV